jgi:hypothetical protein
MVISILGGYGSAYLFRRFGNLYALAFVHGMTGAALPTFWHLSMRVGLSFLKKT